MKISRMGHEVAEQSRLVAQASGDQVHDLAFALERAVDGEQTRAQQLLALPLREVVQTMNLTIALSSSSGAKVTPTAVAGTLRPVDNPRTARKVPCRQDFNFP